MFSYIWKFYPGLGHFPGSTITEQKIFANRFVSMALALVLLKNATLIYMILKTS